MSRDYSYLDYQVCFLKGKTPNVLPSSQRNQLGSVVTVPSFFPCFMLTQQLPLSLENSSHRFHCLVSQLACLLQPKTVKRAKGIRTAGKNPPGWLPLPIQAHLPVDRSETLWGFGSHYQQKVWDCTNWEEKQRLGSYRESLCIWSNIKAARAAGKWCERGLLIARDTNHLPCTHKPCLRLQIFKYAQSVIKCQRID